MLLEGAMNALGKVGLMLNVKRDDLPGVLAVLPALKNPTISQLSDNYWVAVNTILEEITVRTHHSAAEKSWSARHCRISAEQDRDVGALMITIQDFRDLQAFHIERKRVQDGT